MKHLLFGLIPAASARLSHVFVVFCRAFSTNVFVIDNQVQLIFFMITLILASSIQCEKALWTSINFPFSRNSLAFSKPTLILTKITWIRWGTWWGILLYSKVCARTAKRFFVNVTLDIHQHPQHLLHLPNLHRFRVHIEISGWGGLLQTFSAGKKLFTMIALIIPAAKKF